MKTIDAHKTLRLRRGKAEIVMHASGEVTFNGKTLSIDFDGHISLKSERIDVN
ncbi:hypothetical protein [Consotaella aegiceratis]|uniref:hypothetical protein n=1 Tax=Consotaella aegiceratis TaxID=3097961 RepID=UPI002F42E3A2